MIQNDDEFQVTQSRIIALQEILLSLRKTEKPSNYALMSKGYLMEIDKMQAEIMEYLSCIPAFKEASAGQVTEILQRN
ncbi:hypothetical protein H8E77_01305 [bacterium]|nr:hypothetical protein [bacterium]